MRLLSTAPLCLLAMTLYSQRICYQTDSITALGRNYNENVTISLDSTISFHHSKLMLHFENEDTTWTYTIERETMLAGNCPGYYVTSDGHASNGTYFFFCTRLVSREMDLICWCDDPSNPYGCFRFVKRKGTTNWGASCPAPKKRPRSK